VFDICKNVRDPDIEIRELIEADLAEECSTLDSLRLMGSDRKGRRPGRTEGNASMPGFCPLPAFVRVTGILVLGKLIGNWP
jgi:hypothetical protein